ncbi:MAG: DNA alkylation repair enzyme [Pelotomaculum sp. PtaB.Bin104]|nr:MAG: DNA alkylation repair enzyme [Pelotomaculum sp. PtaB.Bin104]
MENIILLIRKELEHNADEKTKNTAQRFFKEKVTVYGVKTSIVSKIAKKYFDQIKHLDKKEIFYLCEQLLQSNYSEDAYIAFDWADRMRKTYDPGDFARFEQWIEKYVDNWAKCDTLCNHAVGSFIEQFPQYLSQLKGWTSSDNRWLRRAAAVTLILPARKGKFLEDIFEISDSLLLDRDDLIQKGYGWMLKEASKAHRQEVFDYVMKNKHAMPRTALRYAIEKLPKDLRDLAMQR